MTTPTPRQWQLLAYVLIATVAAGCALVLLTPTPGQWQFAAFLLIGIVAVACALVLTLVRERDEQR